MTPQKKEGSSMMIKFRNLVPLERGSDGAGKGSPQKRKMSEGSTKKLKEQKYSKINCLLQAAMKNKMKPPLRKKKTGQDSMMSKLSGHLDSQVKRKLTRSGSFSI